MQAIIYKIKMHINISITYRFGVISSLISNFIILLATIYFWRAAYANTATVAGINEKQMITYSVIVAILGSLLRCSIGDTLGDRIREGNIALDLVKPVNIYILFFAQDIGELTSGMLLKAFPLFLFSIIFVRFSAPISVPAFFCFLLSSVLAYLIIWLIGAIVGVMTFWVMNVGPLGFVKDVIIRLLSGSLVPVWFFPKAFQNIINYTPFVYTYQLSAGVYIGKISLSQAIYGNILQVFWIVTLFLIFTLLRIRSTRKVMVQGG